MSTKVQLTGGAFQDVQGNPLANGYLLMLLSQDGQVNGDQQVASGKEIKIILDASGNIQASPSQSVWPNDVISPAGTFYTIWAYTAAGQLVWGPNTEQVFSSPSPFDVGAWIPNEVNTAVIPVVTYDIGIMMPNFYIPSQVAAIVKLERKVRFAIDMIPSTAVAGVNPVGTLVFTLNKNGTQFGTLTIQPDGTTVYASSTGAVFAAGDVLTVVAPSGVDATVRNIGIVLSGTTIG